MCSFAMHGFCKGSEGIAHSELARLRHSSSYASHMHIVVQVLGRVAGLAVLNGAAVTSRERRDAELRYLQV